MGFQLTRALFHNYHNLPLNSKGLELLIELQIGYSLILGAYTLFLSGEAQQESGMMLEEAKELLGLCIITLWLGLMSHHNFLKVGVKVSVVLGLGISLAPIASWALVEIYHHC